LLIGLIYALQYRPVQTYFAKRAAAYLSSELGTTVSLEGLYFKPFSSLVLNGLYVADLAGDTLLYTHRLTASVNLWKIRDRRITINKLALSGGSFYLHRRGDSSNVSFIANYFRPEMTSQSSIAENGSHLMSAALTCPIFLSATETARAAQSRASIIGISVSPN